MSVSGITFVDTDYLASGTQGSFNPNPSDKGCPADAAVAVSRSSDVTVTNCTFLALGGGAVLIANSSSRVHVRANRFLNIGQSGVMFVGNNSNQATHSSAVLGGSASSKKCVSNR